MITAIGDLIYARHHALNTHLIAILKIISRCNTDPIKILMTFFAELEKNNPKIYMEAQKTLMNQSNLEQKEQCWKYQNTQFQNILQSHRNKNSMVLT